MDMINNRLAHRIASGSKTGDIGMCKRALGIALRARWMGFLERDRDVYYYYYTRGRNFPKPIYLNRHDQDGRVPEKIRACFVRPPVGP
jgi:hypothetical protein